MRSRLVRTMTTLALLACAGLQATEAQHLSPEPGTLRDWIRAGEHEDFDWDVDIENPTLRLDQHFEISITVDVEAGKLPQAADDHELEMHTIVTDRDGEVLGISDGIVEVVPAQVHEDAGVEFEQYVSLLPGRYEIWVVLHDNTTGHRNVVRERREIDDIRNDPLPDAYADFPKIGFARVDRSGGLTIRHFEGDLKVPIPSSRPLDIELVTTVSAPEQWPGGNAIARHTANMMGGLKALSQLDPSAGTISITGLDLLRRTIVFEHALGTPVDWTALLDVFDEVNRSALSVDALLGRQENAAFLRDYIHTQLSPHFLEPDAPAHEDEPLKVVIVVAGVMRFDDDADRDEIELEGACDCRVYHLRFKQDIGDLFDQVDDLLEPLDPPTFDLMTARDFRNSIGKIVEDLLASER